MMTNVHLASWLVVTVMVIGLVVGSFVAGPDARDVACTVTGGHGRVIASAPFRGPARAGWAAPDALGRFADAGLGVERDDVAEPAWARETLGAAAQSDGVAPATSLKPMRICSSVPTLV